MTTVLAFFLGMLVMCLCALITIRRWVPSLPSGKHRLSLIFGDKGRENVEWLQKVTGSSDAAQVTAKAYALLDVVYHEHVQGSQLVIRRHDGAETIIKLGGEGSV